MKNKLIDKHTTIEYLTGFNPLTSIYLIEKGIRNIHSSDHHWGTLENVCLSKGFTPEDIEIFIRELNDMS